MADYEGQVIQPVEPVGPEGIVVCPPGHPGDWFTTINKANVKRTYDYSESEGLEKEWLHQGLKVRTDQDYRDAHDVRQADQRAALTRQEAAYRELDTKLTDVRQTLHDALWAVYLEHKDNAHNWQASILSDALESARVARAYTWDLDAERQMTRAMLKEALDANLSLFREFQRGGAVPYQKPE